MEMPDEEDPINIRPRRFLSATALAVTAVGVIVATSLVLGVVERERGCSSDDELCVGPEGV